MDLQSQRHEILRIAAGHGARNVRLFGSVARGEDHGSSDVDSFYLGHIRDAIADIQTYASVDRATFIGDRMENSLCLANVKRKNMDRPESDLLEVPGGVLMQQARDQGLVRQPLGQRALLDRLQILAR